MEHYFSVLHTLCQTVATHMMVYMTIFRYLMPYRFLLSIQAEKIPAVSLHPRSITLFQKQKKAKLSSYHSYRSPLSHHEQQWCLALNGHLDGPRESDQTSTSPDRSACHQQESSPWPTATSSLHHISVGW